MNLGRISILGCGWLGVPLARHFISKGYDVKGSVTSVEKLNLLRNYGIKPYRIALTETSVEIDDVGFFDTDVLIISLPPRRIEAISRIYPAQITQLLPFVLRAGIKKVIFISSTSVYPESLQQATEEGNPVPEKESGLACLLAEVVLKNRKEFETTIVRFGGLIGADRNPARFLQKSTMVFPNVPVNLIHQDDCIGILSEIVRQELWGETLNACCPEHPYKKDFYSKAARLSGLPSPSFSDSPGTYKFVDSSKLIKLLDYQFIYKNPMDYLDTMIQE